MLILALKISADANAITRRSLKSRRRTWMAFSGRATSHDFDNGDGISGIKLVISAALSLSVLHCFCG